MDKWQEKIEELVNNVQCDECSFEEACDIYEEQTDSVICSLIKDNL